MRRPESFPTPGEGRPCPSLHISPAADGRARSRSFCTRSVPSEARGQKVLEGARPSAIQKNVWATTTLKPTGPSDVFAVGYAGTITHFNGAAWKQSKAATTNQLWSVWGSSPTDVFIVGENGTILQRCAP